MSQPYPNAQLAAAPRRATLPKFRPLAVAVHIALLSLGAGAGSLALIPEARAEDATVTTPARKTYNISPGPLAKTLNQFAQQAGLILSYDPALAAGSDSKGLTGEYSIAEGLNALLAGTGLASRFTSARTVTLERAVARREEDTSATSPGTSATNAITTLPSVTVSAERDDNLDVDEGFKADFQSSATKTPLSIRETPQSISVITRESIEARQARDLGSVLELSAGAAVVGSSGGPSAGLGRFAREAVVLRGQVLDEGRDIRIDGFAVGGETLIDPALFERVEVVKGPSSVLYGPGSLSGFINRVSKKPQTERATSVVGQIGSFDTYRTEFDITGALDANDRFAGRLIAVYEDSGSFTDGVDRQRSLLAPSFEARLGERTRVLVQGLLQDDSGTPSVGIPLIAEADGELRTPAVSRSFYLGVPRNSEIETDQQQVSVRVDHEISDSWLATLLLQNGQSSRASRFDNYGYGFYAGGDTYLYSAAGRAEADFWAGELRIDGQFNLLGREHRLLLGVESREVDRVFGNSFVDIGVGNIYADNFDEFDSVAISTPIKSAIDLATQAVYGQFIFGLSERTRLIAGLRYDHSDQRNRNDLDQAEPSDDRAKNDEFTYRLALSQDLTANLSGFASYSTSFVPVVARSRSGAVLDPETGEGLELGVKGEWFSQRLGTSLTVFRQERDKVPLDDRLPEDDLDDNFSRSSGLQRTDGLELELSGQPMPGLTLGVAAAWLDTEFLEGEETEIGQTTPGTIKRQTNLFAHYEIQQGSLQGLGMGFTLVSLGDRFAPFGDVGRFAKGYERVDLNFSYTAIPNWDLSLQVRNVLDERYIENISFAPYQNYFGAPRSVLFRAKYSFD